jgi:hypothetical protein
MRDVSVRDWEGLDPKIDGILTGQLFVYTLRQFVGMCEGDRERVVRLMALGGLSEDGVAALRADAERRLAALPEVVVRGILEDFFETGTEGVMWAVYEDGKTGYDGLHRLEAGDHLLITDEAGAARFEGFIEPDFEKGWTEYPMNPGHGQPCALGMWIHWTQSGWEPDDWAALFVRPRLRDARQGPALRAVLTMNKKRA